MDTLMTVEQALIFVGALWVVVCSLVGFVVKIVFDRLKDNETKIKDAEKQVRDSIVTSEKKSSDSVKEVETNYTAKFDKVDKLFDTLFEKVDQLFEKVSDTKHSLSGSLLLITQQMSEERERVDKLYRRKDECELVHKDE